MGHRPDVTAWLRNLEEPEPDNRPWAFKDGVFMHGTGELMDWVGQGYGGVRTTELLDAVETACRRSRFKPHDVVIVAYKNDTAPHPYEIRTDILFHPSSDDDQVTIFFREIKEGV